MRAGSPFDFFFFFSVCEREKGSGTSYVAWKRVLLAVRRETEASSASLILFNFKDKRQITSLYAFSFLTLC